MDARLRWREPEAQFYRIRKNGSGFQVLGLVMDGFNTVNQQNFVWNLQADGTVQNVRKMVSPGTQNLDFGWYPRADEVLLLSMVNIPVIQICTLVM